MYRAAEDRKSINRQRGRRAGGGPPPPPPTTLRRERYLCCQVAENLVKKYKNLTQLCKIYLKLRQPQRQFCPIDQLFVSLPLEKATVETWQQCHRYHQSGKQCRDLATVDIIIHQSTADGCDNFEQQCKYSTQWSISNSDTRTSKHVVYTDIKKV